MTQFCGIKYPLVITKNFCIKHGGFMRNGRKDYMNFQIDDLYEPVTSEFHEKFRERSTQRLSTMIDFKKACKAICKHYSIRELENKIEVDFANGFRYRRWRYNNQSNATEIASDMRAQFGCWIYERP